MKKLLLLIALPFMFLTLSAQITQEQADVIAIEHLGNVASNFILYAKEDVQTGFEINTTTGEILELSYLCWIYFVHFTDETYNKYLIVKESNGNVLETNVKKDDVPDGLEDWRTLLPMEFPFEEYSLEGTSCQWINLDYPYKDGELIIINSIEELDNYMSCTAGDYPEIDFARYTLLIANGEATQLINFLTTTFFTIKKDEYKMKVKVIKILAMEPEIWCVPILVLKITDESIVTLDVQYDYY